MPRWYFEDLTPGRTFEAASQTPVTAEAIKAFARDFDPQPFHLDEAAAKKSLFGALCASGLHTTALSMRLATEALFLQSATLGSPGVEVVRWHKPVFVGDTLAIRVTLKESKPSKSRPTQGSVLLHWEVKNQKGEAVMELDGWVMFQRRPT